MRYIVMASLSLIVRVAVAAPQLVGSGDLAAFKTPPIALKKGQCYTFTLELEEGATLTKEMLRGGRRLTVWTGKFAYRAMTLKPAGPRRYTGALTPCEKAAAQATLDVTVAGDMRSVAEAGSGRFKVWVEARPAKAREMDDGIRAGGGMSGRRRAAQAVCDQCVRQNQGNLPGFRRCLSDRRIRADECL